MDVCFIFNGGVVYTCSEAYLTRGSEDKYTKNALFLVDLNESRHSAMDFPNQRMVVSSPPQSGRYREWLQHRDGFAYYMKTWDENEMGKIK